MVRPEPDQPLDKADLGAERGVEARLGFGEIDLLRHARAGIARRLCGRRRPRLLRGLHLRRRGRGGLRTGASRIGARRVAVLRGLRGALGLLRRPLRLLEGEGRAPPRRWPADRCRQCGGAGAIQFGQQRTARIRGDGGDRSGARAETEPMQGERSFGFGIEGHASRSFPPGRDATPQQEASSATAVSRLRWATFRQNERDMKNPKGDRERLQGDTVVERHAYASHNASRPMAMVTSVSGAPTLK